MQWSHNLSVAEGIKGGYSLIRSGDSRPNFSQGQWSCMGKLKRIEAAEPTLRLLGTQVHRDMNGTGEITC
jgi:hypothetical protein